MILIAKPDFCYSGATLSLKVVHFILAVFFTRGTFFMAAKEHISKSHPCRL